MRITRLGGITADADTTLYQADKIECMFEADGAINVGAPVKLDVTSNLNCTLVVEAAAILDHRQFVGIYEGEGGTGAAVGTTTPSQSTGNAAVDGDLIMVTTYGRAIARQDGTTPTVLGEALQIEAGGTSNLIGGVTAVTNGGTNSILVTCMEVCDADDEHGVVFVRGM